MIIRIKSNKGQSRVTIEKSDTTSILYEKTAAVLGISASDFQLGINGSLVKQNAATLEQSGIKHGDILELKYLQNDTPSSTPKPNLVKGAIAPVPIKDHPVDALLEKEDGKIYRTKDSHFCKHGATGMCDYCMPLEPYDSTYLTENKIKHMSYHSYLRQITSSNKSALPTSSHFIPPLDNFTFTVKVPCSSGTHDPYPAGICTKCQPSAATLQSQNFRMVDHLEFESASLIENFLQFWRKTGIQRFGYLYGRYEPYAQVPLGVKAVVCAIYEPKQQGATDSIQVELTPEPMEKEMKEFEELMGLEKIGMIYTDLTHDSTGAGTVVCKRHADSYFLSSAECMFSGLMQLKYPTVTKYSCDGVFGSRFITCVISGNENNEIDISSFQVSNMGMCMVKDDIIEASMDPSLIRVKKSTPTHYIPEVFYKYKNEYGRLVQEAAAPTFPVDYLLVTQTHGFPQTPTPTFTSPTAFPIENRDGLLNRQELSDVKKHLSSVLSLGNQDDLFKLLDDFHILFYFMTGGIIEKNDFKVLVDAIKTKNFRTFQKFVSSASWQTMLTLLNEIASFSSSIQGPVSANKPSGGVWVCRHCTFRNSDTEMCEMCGTVLLFLRLSTTYIELLGLPNE